MVMLIVVVGIALLSAQAGRTSGAILFEGARLITGATGAPIESSAFLVENGRFTKVGRKGAVQAPAGAARVDLTGKTVMPALIDIHNHIGWTNHKTNQATKTSFTRELVIDHLQRYAYYGVAAALSLGLDRWDVNPDLPYQLRNEVIPNAARFLTVGRGIAATPMAGPPVDYRLGVPYGAQTATEGRALVQALKARNVEMIKIWVDDRQKTVPKLQVNVYEAIINEAHKNRMRVVAHIFNLDDGKQLLKSGVDGFGHGVRDRDVDEEYLKIVKQHPKTWVGPNLPGRTLSVEETAAEIDWLTDTLPPSQIKRMRAELDRRQAAAAGGGRGAGGQSDLFAVQCRNLKKVAMPGYHHLGTDVMAIRRRPYRASRHGVSRPDPRSDVAGADVCGNLKPVHGDTAAARAPTLSCRRNPLTTFNTRKSTRSISAGHHRSAALSKGFTPRRTAALRIRSQFIRKFVRLNFPAALLGVRMTDPNRSA